MSYVLLCSLRRSPFVNKSLSTEQLNAKYNCLIIQYTMLYVHSHWIPNLFVMKTTIVQQSPTLHAMCAFTLYRDGVFSYLQCSWIVLERFEPGISFITCSNNIWQPFFAFLKNCYAWTNAVFTTNPSNYLSVQVINIMPHLHIRASGEANSEANDERTNHIFASSFASPFVALAHEVIFWTRVKGDKWRFTLCVQICECSYAYENSSFAQRQRYTNVRANGEARARMCKCGIIYFIWANITGHWLVGWLKPKGW